jgi:flavorubredoxin
MKRQPDNRLPRELAAGVHWLGQCTGIEYQGRLLHQYSSAFLVVGDSHSALVETGLPSDMAVIREQLDALLATGVPDLRYIFITHGELPHAGGAGRLLAAYPDTIACGDVSDLHLVFPQFTDRLWPLDPGDTVDLGGTELRVVEAVFRDLPSTRWAFDTGRRVLFAADGFAFSHLHAEGHCGLLGEEAAPTLDLADQIAIFALAAFHWTQHVDIEAHIARLDELLADLKPNVVAPTHGLPFTDFDAIVPEIRAGLRLGSRLDSAVSITDRAVAARGR